MHIANWTIIAAVLTSIIMSASAQDFTLDIFGNANEDDLVDSKDVVYLEGILNGTEKPTDLADANHDGKVDQADADRIKQIIDGTESELYYINCLGEAARIKHPINKIIIAYDNTAEIIRILGAEDRVVGVDSEGGSGAIGKYPRYFPEFNKTPSIGNRNDCNAEEILKLKPDALILGIKKGCPEIEAKIKDSDIDVVRLETWSNGVPSLMMLAYMLDEVDNARKYIDWQNGYLDMVREKVAGIPLDKRPKVFVDRPGNTTVIKGSGYSEAIEMAGGINIAANLTGSSDNTLPPVDTEWVLEQNPDHIVGLCWYGGYENDDMGVLKARYDQIMATPGFNDTNAGKNNNPIFRTFDF
jgi:iron complex transport system substrate-binding protein